MVVFPAGESLAESRLSSRRGNSVSFNGSILGYDPGGNGSHGVALCQVQDDQIANIENDGAKSFANADVAERACNKMINESLITSDGDIEHFVSIYLTKIGLTKRVTTL